MDQDRILALKTKAALAEFQKIIPIWDNKKEIISDTRVAQNIPNNILITPDESGVVMSFPGKVGYINFYSPGSSPFTLVEHNHKKYYPMIAVAMPDKGELLIVSLLNPEESNQNPHCIVSHNELLSNDNWTSNNIFSNTRWHENIIIDNPVQAITLSADGKILAVVPSDGSIQIFDLVRKSNAKKFFMPRVQIADNNIRDISTATRISSQSDDRHIAAVSGQGVIDVKKISTKDHDIAMENIKDIKTGESIEKIHLFATQDLLYVTSAGEVKIISTNDWLDHFQGNIKDRIISYHGGNKGAVDQGLNYGTIHWIDRHDAFKDDRYRMYVHRENNTAVEDFTIFIPDGLEQKYKCTTVTGQTIERPMHILAAALRENTIIALFADGNLYRWLLPKKYKKPTDSMVTSQNPNKLKIVRPVKKDSSPTSSPSSPSVPSRTRDRSSTEGGEVKSDGSGDLGKKSQSQSPVSPRRGNQSRRENQWMPPAKKRGSSSGEEKNKQYMEALKEDVLSDFTKKKDKK